MPSEKFETVGPDGDGRRVGWRREERRGENGGDGQKHKTPDNITHPFPDYPFEKLFCRWMGGRPSRRSISSHVREDTREKDCLPFPDARASAREHLSAREAGKFPSLFLSFSLSFPRFARWERVTLIISVFASFHTAPRSDKSPMRLRLIRRLGSRASAGRISAPPPPPHSYIRL